MAGLCIAALARQELTAAALYTLRPQPLPSGALGGIGSAMGRLNLRQTRRHTQRAGALGGGPAGCREVQHRRVGPAHPSRTEMPVEEDNCGGCPRS